MIRTIITTSDRNIVIPVPKKYVGKKIEVIMFEVEEINKQTTDEPAKLKPSQLRGFLSHDTAEAMQQHVQQSRNEWNAL